MRVAVLAGGRSSEHEVSLDSARGGARRRWPRPATRSLACALERDGALDGPDGAALALAPGGGLLGADVAFPVLHGPFGEDGTIQGLLELLDVPYVGAGVLASSLCMDKVVFKEVLAAAGVPQVAYAGGARGALAGDAGRGARRARARSGCRVFVKPARLGSSVGIVEGRRGRASSTRRSRRAFAHDGLVIVEAFSPGIEVECSVTGLGEPEASLPGRDRARRAPTGTTTRPSTRRAAWSSRSRRGSATTWSREVRRLARETFLRVGLRRAGAGRLLRRGRRRVLVNELNTLPGMTATSGFPKMWEATGVPFPEVCDRLLALAARALPRRARGHALLGRRLAEQRDVGDLDALRAGRQLRDPDEVVAVALAVGASVKRWRLRLTVPPPTSLPLVASPGAPLGAAPSGAT